MDVVYLVRPGEANDELRNSLRSLKNLPHDTVWIAGYRPRGRSGRMIPMAQTLEVIAQGVITLTFLALIPMGLGALADEINDRSTILTRIWDQCRRPFAFVDRLQDRLSR